jgi:hypothetical protein
MEESKGRRKAKKGKVGEMNGPLRRTKKGKGIREARRGEGERGREGKRKRQCKADERDIK